MKSHFLLGFLLLGEPSARATTGKAVRLPETNFGPSFTDRALAVLFGHAKHHLSNSKDEYFALHFTKHDPDS